MTIDFKRPVLVGTPDPGRGLDRPVRAGGWSRPPARIVDADGTVLATAEAVYVAADEARKRELQERYGYRIRLRARPASRYARTRGRQERADARRTGRRRAQR